MSTNPIGATLPGYATSSLADYWVLAKPEVNFLIAITAGAAFRAGTPSDAPLFPWLLLFHTVLGTLLVAGGAGALNQWMEHRFDAKMRRTARRPGPADARLVSATLYAAQAPDPAMHTGWRVSRRNACVDRIRRSGG